MIGWFRRGAAILALALLTVGAAQARTQPPADPGAVVVATVNGQRITRAAILEEALADQLARLRSTDPQAADVSGRPVYELYALVGAGDVVVQRLRQSGGRPVTFSRADLYRAVFARPGRALRDAVQNKIRETVIVQAAAKAGVTVTPAEMRTLMTRSVAQARAARPALAGKPDAAVLASYGVRADFVARNLRLQALLEKLIQRDIERGLGRRLGPADFLRASHVLVQVTDEPAAPAPDQPAPTEPPAPPTPEEREKRFADAKTKIDGIAADIRSGKVTFEDAAQTHNNDQTRFQRGSLGVFMRGQMVAEFDRVAFGLAKGAVSEPIRTAFGWHLIRVDDLGAQIAAAEREQVLQAELRKRMPTTIQDLMGQAKITSTIAPAAAPATTLGPPRP
ncbi:MAG TPA: peptidylprolyl isomerase [Chthonomonadales bacterium]|nr:peptidylprolyl isomerase [Chthonomonadales bacterium]